MLTRVHINQHVIKRNAKTGEREPCITIKQGKTNTYAHEAILRDDDGGEVGRVVYRPDKPLSCGAKVWIQVSGEVEPLIRDDE